MWQQNQRRWPKDRLYSDFFTFQIPTHYTVVKRGYEFIPHICGNKTKEDGKKINSVVKIVHFE